MSARGTRAADGGAGAVAGLLVEFETPAALRAAAERVRDAGYTRWDAFSPFPVHGLEEAMGLRNSPLPRVVLAGGMMGAAGALLLQWWTNAVDYRFLISDKPYFSLPADIPVMFELTVLLSAISAVAAMFVLNGLPRFRHPTLRSARFKRVTTDRFFICIEAADPRFDADGTSRFLAGLGGTAVERLWD